MMPDKTLNTTRTGEQPRLERDTHQREQDRVPEDYDAQYAAASTTGVIHIITEASDDSATREADRPAGE